MWLYYMPCGGIITAYVASSGEVVFPGPVPGGILCSLWMELHTERVIYILPLVRCSFVWGQGGFL